MANPIPGVYNTAIPGSYPPGTEEQAAEMAANINPFSKLAVDNGVPGDNPYYSTGARALIRIGGKAMGVAQRIKWDVSFNATPINTVDSIFPWDIDVGQARITADLSIIIDPTKGPEHDLMLPIMRSAAHAPYVEIQVVDKVGSSIFYAKGMFVGISSQVSNRELSTTTARFIGTSYQHFVAQSFKPYNSLAGFAGGIIAGLSAVTSVFPNNNPFAAATTSDTGDFANEAANAVGDTTVGSQTADIASQVSSGAADVLVPGGSEAAEAVAAGTFPEVSSFPLPPTPIEPIPPVP